MQEQSSNPSIPFYRAVLPDLREYVRLLEVIWQSRMLSNFSRFCQELESFAANYLKSEHVKAVVSGDIGLLITLKALGLPEGAPCYISDFTFNSTMNAAIWSGLRPVLVDINKTTFNMDPDSLRKVMKKYKQPGVVLATHVFGNPCDVPALEELAREQDCFLIFDAAHALGSRRGGVPVGVFGDAEVLSLSGTKIVTSAEGGLISTKHAWLAEKVTYLRGYGFQHDYHSRYVGINGKISELHCALGLLSLQNIERLLELRQDIVRQYKIRLKDLVGWQEIGAADTSTFKDLALWFGGSRESVEGALRTEGIQTKRYFLPLHRMQAYRQFCDITYPATEEVYENTLCVPAYPELTENEIERISNCIVQNLG